MSKLSRSVEVALGSGLVPVGRLVFESDGQRQASMFRYDSRWLDNPARFAISPHLPLGEASITASGTRENRRAALPFAIADTAPDAWGRGLIGKSLGRPANELEYLLLADDLTRQGALRFVDESGTPQSQAQPAIPRLNDLEDLRELARVYESDPASAPDVAGRLMGFVGSLGGARPKANLDDNGVLSIAKFTSERDTMPIERVEVATLRLAAEAGLNVPGARLELAKTDRPVAVIARFDRRGSARIPYLSGQSFTGIDATEGGYYTDIADGLRAHGLDPKRQIAELYRRMLFTILVSNNDDHLKNHGVLYAGEGKWVLSPAFDINPQPERHRHLETGISPLSANMASIEAAIEAAPFFDLQHTEAISALARVLEVIENRWRPLLLSCGLSEKQAKTYAPAFDHDETDIARKLVSQSR